MPKAKTKDAPVRAPHATTTDLLNTARARLDEASAHLKSIAGHVDQLQSNAHRAMYHLGTAHHLTQEITRGIAALANDLFDAALTESTFGLSPRPNAEDTIQ